MEEVSPMSGATFGRYVLGPELGKGGMATVTFGVATGALGFARPVAIKRMHPALAHDAPGLRDAIRDEARIAARVRHPNVVSVLDVIEDGDDVGIVLEYIHGEALSSLLRSAAERREPLPPGVAVAILVDVLHGLHAAHTAVDEAGAPLDIVHRDVSPQNVIVGSDGVARVLDFGIAKAENRVSVTRGGQVKGKLRYMAPEQVGGEAAAASDVYAAGLVLWELLVGWSPFEDTEDSAQLLARVIMGVSRAPSEHRSAVPRPLDLVVARALAVAPDGRFRTAAEMAEALEATGLVASRTSVASWVNELARDALDARSKVVALLERGLSATEGAPPPFARNVRAESVAPTPGSTFDRRLPWAVAALLALAAGGLALARSSPPPLAAVAAPTLPSVLASAPPAPIPPPSSAAAVVVTAPAAPATSARASSRGRKGRAGAADCAVPYTVDVNGDRHYRRECIE